MNCVVHLKEMKLVLTIIKIIILLSALAFTTMAAATKLTQKFLLGETEVKINVYEKEGSRVTFVSPHHNEQIARRLAQEYIEKNGGRLVEIESFDEKGNPSRNLKFTLNGKIFNIDPNRIFTDNGRRCGGIAPEIAPTVKKFADDLLKIILSEDAKSLREGERFIVAVHNNTDVDAKDIMSQPNDLTASAFVKVKNSSHGFQEQAEGVYLSNSEDDPDNFIFVSTPKYVSYFAEKGFNVVIQKNAGKLRSEKCSVDDGSFSVFSAQNNIQYICLEADNLNGAFRQREMFEALYQLAQAENKIDKTLALNK
jgi:hypothetical protein